MVDTGDKTAIPVPVMGGGPMGTLAWSPDGNSLAFQALKRVQAAEYEPIGLLVVDLIGKQVRPLVDAPVTQFSWSPDSRNITYVQAGDIHLVDVESGETKNLTNKKGSNSSPTWAPAE
jgi:Tol biopolymer transport system component